MATGVSTVATSLSSAAVSLAGPFLRQASKQVINHATMLLSCVACFRFDCVWLSRVCEYRAQFFLLTLPG